MRFLKQNIIEENQNSLNSFYNHIVIPKMISIIIPPLLTLTSNLKNEDLLDIFSNKLMNYLTAKS